MPVLSLSKDKGACAVGQQVAVVVPSIRHTIHVCQAVGIVVLVGVGEGDGGRNRLGHGRAVAN
jgi:hypothetical protein